MGTSVFHHTGAIKNEILTPSEVNRQDAADWRRSSERILLFYQRSSRQGHLWEICSARWE